MKKKQMLRNLVLVLVPVLVAVTALAVFSILPKNDRFLLEGTVEIASRTCFAQAGGRVESMLVQTGQPVKAGEVLAVIDDRAVDEQAAQMEQMIKIKTAQFKQMKALADGDTAAASRRVAESNVALWEETLAQAQRTSAAAGQNLADQQVLFESGAISRAEFQKYQQAAWQAQSQVVTTKAQLEAAKNSVKALPQADADEEALQAAQAELDLTRLQLKQLEDSRKDYQICASSDGVVISTSLEEGASVAAGQSVFKLSDGSQQYAVFYLPQEYLEQVAFGAELSFFLQGKKEEAARGRVCYIDWQAVYPPEDYENDGNRNKRSVKVKAELEDGAVFGVGQSLFLSLKTVQD
ncbi:MAG: efflux RND transporter periplasmic adaptor subunit [Lachnospiraceae bacterium]|nr:efflux RND transporter periplasmic adaptor subunit [Lachnospiraceae bacterium]